MTDVMTFKIHVVRRKCGRSELREGNAPLPPSLVASVPSRISRLLAVAHRVEGLVRTRKLSDYSQVATLAGITRARVSQVMNLLLLAPDIQEQLLFLNKPSSGRELINEQALRPVCAEPDWANQRELFRTLMDSKHERRLKGVA